MGKKIYRVRNWKDYNKALVERGNLTYWISKDVLAQWQYQGKRCRGGVRYYSDLAIQTALIIKELFHLPYRSCEGFLKSLLKYLNLPNLKIPHYTTLSRRASSIRPQLTRQVQQQHALHVLIDSTGISLYGEGEWKRKRHGEDNQKAWVKLHLAVNWKTRTILSMLTSGSRAQDGDYLAPLIDDIASPIEAIYGDGAFDRWKCYLKAFERGAVLITPPQRGARLQVENRNHSIMDALNCRDNAIRWIRSYEVFEEGRRQWKINSDYSRRALVENTMYRLKSLFGDVVRCRDIKNQITQLTLRCYILNQFTQFGMPQSVPI